MFLPQIFVLLFVVICNPYNVFGIEPIYKIYEKYDAFIQMTNIVEQDHNLMGIGIANNKLYIFLSSLWLYIGNPNEVIESPTDGLTINVTIPNISAMIDLSMKPAMKKALCGKNPKCKFTRSNVVLYTRNGSLFFGIIKKPYKSMVIKFFDSETFEPVGEIATDTAIPLNARSVIATEQNLAFIIKFDDDGYYWAQDINRLVRLGKSIYERDFKFGMISGKDNLIHLFKPILKTVWTVKYAPMNDSNGQIVNYIASSDSSVVKMWNSVFNINKTFLNQKIGRSDDTEDVITPQNSMPIQNNENSMNNVKSEVKSSYTKKGGISVTLIIILIIIIISTGLTTFFVLKTIPTDKPKENVENTQNTQTATANNKTGEVFAIRSRTPVAAVPNVASIPTAQTASKTSITKSIETSSGLTKNA